MFLLRSSMKLMSNCCQLLSESPTDQLILLVASDIRPAVRHITQCRPGLTVLGFDEIVQGTPIQTKAILGEPVLSAR